MSIAENDDRAPGGGSLFETWQDAAARGATMAARLRRERAGVWQTVADIEEDIERLRGRGDRAEVARKRQEEKAS